MPEKQRLRFEITLLQYAADQASYQGRHDEAYDAGETLLKLAHRRGDRKGSALIRNIVGEFCRLAGKMDEAASHYREARRLWAEIGNHVDCAISVINMALIRANQGRYSDALKYWTTALENLEDHDPAMAARLRPAALGVWAANNQWERWQNHIVGAIDVAANGECGLDMLDAFANSCLLSWRRNAPSIVLKFAQAIQASLAKFDVQEVVGSVQAKLDMITTDDSNRAN